MQGPRLQQHSGKEESGQEPFRLSGDGMRIKRIKRTAEITIERSRLVAATRPRLQKIARCPRCLAEARLITPEEASSLSGVSVREIFRRVEAGRIHFIETSEGLLFICANSLFI
jgi:hypothetical protein